MFFLTLQMMCWRSSQFSSWCSLPPSVFGVAMTAAARGPSSSPLRCCAQPVVPACAAVASASTREQSGVEQRAEGRGQRAERSRAQRGAHEDAAISQPAAARLQRVHGRNAPPSERSPRSSPVQRARLRHDEISEKTSETGRSRSRSRGRWRAIGAAA